MSRKIVITLHVLSWTLLFIAGFSVYSQFIAPGIALARTTVNIGLLAGLFYANVYGIVEFYEKQRKSAYALLSVVAIVVVLIIRTFSNYLFAEQTATAEIPERPVVYISVTLLTTILIYVFSALFALLQNRTRQEREHLAKLNLLQASQLKYLKSQLNPHFLFNTLNNIYSLVLVKSDKAPSMLIKLSDLLRYAIYQGKNSTVTVETEIEQIKKYFALFQMKSKRNLPISWIENISNSNCQIPPMLLISLVENAFKHSDIIESETGFIEFNLNVTNKQLEFVAKNSFSQTSEKDKTGGVGLSNIRETLSILYPNRFQFKSQAENLVFTVKLVIDYDH